MIWQRGLSDLGHGLQRILKLCYVGDCQPSMHLHNKLTANNYSYEPSIHLLNRLTTDNYPCEPMTILSINNFKHTTDASTIDTNFAAIMDSFLDTKNKTQQEFDLII